MLCRKKLRLPQKVIKRYTVRCCIALTCCCCFFFHFFALLFCWESPPRAKKPLAYLLGDAVSAPCHSSWSDVASFWRKRRAFVSHPPKTMAAVGDSSGRLCNPWPLWLVNYFLCNWHRASVLWLEKAVCACDSNLQWLVRGCEVYGAACQAQRRFGTTARDWISRTALHSGESESSLAALGNSPWILLRLQRSIVFFQLCRVCT